MKALTTEHSQQPEDGAPPSLRARRAEKRQLEILEAALVVLSEVGYAGASMEHIAERALLTRVALYKHFPDKASLVIALREWQFRLLADQIVAACQDVPSATEKIRVIVGVLLAFQQQNAGFFRVLLASSFSNDVPPDIAIKPMLYFIASVLEQGIKEGELRPLDVTETAGMLMTLAFSPAIKEAFVPLMPEMPRPLALSEQICGLLLHGLAREP
jgi:AcrR family transcriptional regulator